MPNTKQQNSTEASIPKESNHLKAKLKTLASSVRPNWKRIQRTRTLEVRRETNFIPGSRSGIDGPSRADHLLSHFIFYPIFHQLFNFLFFFSFCIYISKGNPFVIKNFETQKRRSDFETVLRYFLYRVYPSSISTVSKSRRKKNTHTNKQIQKR